MSHKVRRKDQFERKHGGGYDADEFEEHPERYISTFAHKIAPYASVITNGIYWSPKTPRLMTIPDAKSLLTPINSPWMSTTKGMLQQLNICSCNVSTLICGSKIKTIFLIFVGSPHLPHRLIGICDISADPGGSIEFMNECTTIDEPFCLYDADMNQDKKTFKVL